MKNNITHYSRGLYSTWTYIKPYRLLIDAGEGISNYMGNRVFAVEKIILSHGHLDHLSGLIGFFGLRRGAQGDHEKPLEIISSCDLALSRAKEMFKIAFPHGEKSCPYKVRFRKLGWGVPVDLNKFTKLELVKTNHTDSSCGVLVYSISTRLKEPYRSSADFVGKIKEKKQRVTPQHLESHYKPLFLCLLDNKGVVDFNRNSFSPVGVKFMIDDLTFPDDHHNDKQMHNNCANAAKNANAIVPEKLLFSHLSSRYITESKKLEKRVIKLLLKNGMKKPLASRTNVFHPSHGLDHPYLCDINI